MCFVSSESNRSQTTFLYSMASLKSGNENIHFPSCRKDFKAVILKRVVFQSL
jgi:hypothetical protein